ncbi:MAG: PEGA domain-containing protein [Methanocorpusculum sp.]|nr:PEGA domain-containing protein [Methanocorpusculum sp.]
MNTMIKRILAILFLLVLLCGTASAVSTTLTITVFDNNANYDAVSGANVTITKGLVSNTLFTDVNGAARFTEVEYGGVYTLSIARSGYITQTKSINISEMPKSYAVYLVSETPVSIKITTEDGTSLAGAVITIDGKEAGTTNSAGLLHVSIGKGAYHLIAVNADSYEPYSSSRYISSDLTTLTISLSKSRLTPLILIYNENKLPISGAAVYIDNYVVSYSDTYGRAQLSTYTTGTYDLKVEKDGYASYEQEIEFTSATSDIIVELNYTTVPLKIYVAANGKPVLGALVYFNGTITGITDEIGSYTTSVKPGTTIPISVSAEGYSESSVTYQVLADSDNKVTITLSENIPTTLIGLMALGIIIVLLILILVVTGKNRRGKKSRKSRPPVSGGRDSL